MNASVSNAAPHVVILAAGEGDMKTGGLRALTPVFYRPMIRRVLDAAMAVAHRSIRVVVGTEEERLREECRDFPEVVFCRQEAPLGTADALRAVEAPLGGEEGTLLVLRADRVLLNPGTLSGLLAAHAESGAVCTRAGGVAYCFLLPEPFGALRGLAAGGPRPGSRFEDAADALAAAGAKIADCPLGDPDEAASLDDLYELWRVETILRARHHRGLMREGVALRDPAATHIDPRCRFGRDVVIEGGVILVNSALESGVYVEHGCRIVDSEIGAGTLVKQGTRVESARAGKNCVLGPCAHLRPGTQLADGVRIGNFVEIKNARIGAGTKISHLSFIGDASVGRDVNVGCGFVTCNNDGGPVKQRTIIEDGVFIGSGSQAIAPVTLGAGSFVATGSSVTEDVPPDSFVISRGRQVTKPGYAKKYGRGKIAAARPAP